MPIKDGAVNQRIAEVRKALGMRQDEFAEAIKRGTFGTPFLGWVSKVSRSYIGALETSQREINDRIIELICLNCGVNEKWLRNGTGKMFKERHNPQLDRVIRVYEKLDGYLQEYVIGQMELLLECQEKNKEKK